jgi:hypothetical protein
MKDNSVLPLTILRWQLRLLLPKVNEKAPAATRMRVKRQVFFPFVSRCDSREKPQW